MTISQDAIFPYENEAQRPCCAPTILGVPTRTEYHRLTESNCPRHAWSDGAKIQFMRNSVVTGMIVSNDTHSNPVLCWDDQLMIEKNGKEHLFTDGVQPQNVFPDMFRFYGKYTSLWIPVDAGEIWRSTFLNAGMITKSFYSVQFRVERLLDKPSKIPEWLPSSVIYTNRAKMPANGTNSFEFDYREDGVVTGFHGISDNGVRGSAEVQVLMEGEQSLCYEYQTARGMDLGDFFQQQGNNIFESVWFPVNRREKWQIHGYNLTDAERGVGVMARVEERRRPWERW